VAFSGSCVAFAKLQGLMNKAIRLPGRTTVNFVLSGHHLVGIGLTVAYSAHPSGFEIFLFFVLALALGVILVLPIGGADMPVVISLFNAFTGLAVGFKGFVLGNPALIMAGIVVGAARHAAHAADGQGDEPPDQNILFAPITGAAVEGGEAVEGTMRELSRWMRRR
jgi:NAD(P) transhydrogenase subunit beta